MEKIRENKNERLIASDGYRSVYDDVQTGSLLAMAAFIDSTALKLNIHGTHLSDVTSRPLMIICADAA